MVSRFTFRKPQHLRTKAEFDAVYNARIKEVRGPFVIFFKTNDLGFARLGVSVPKRIGAAPVRNRIRRLVREAFRLMQQDFPRGFDILVVARHPQDLVLADVQKIMSGVMVKMVHRFKSDEATEPRSDQGKTQ